jgi:2-polyprenyl-6-hydroxyphenyl methylase/3-demethylubiquinone-9 3-methyltransferase
LDIGCGAGTQAGLWAELGHQVRGIDINGELLEIARRRSRERGLNIDFAEGSASSLGYMDSSMDVVLLPELLEHVVDWQACLNEGVRVLRPNGVLYLSTTNALCPHQQEFDLPLYSWYPGFIKRHFEKLAVTTRRELVQYAAYPAVNWFTPYQLAGFLERKGMRCMDRFDMLDDSVLFGVRKGVAGALRRSRLLRFLGHVLTPSTVIFAIKRSASS